LKNYFGCDNPFDDYGKITPEGETAQEKLINLLKDLEAVGVIHDARAAEHQIDEICNDYDWETRALDLLSERYPNDPSDLRCDFMQHWMNLRTDEENIKEYERMRNAGEISDFY